MPWAGCASVLALKKMKLLWVVLFLQVNAFASFGPSFKRYSHKNNRQPVLPVKMQRILQLKNAINQLAPDIKLQIAQNILSIPAVRHNIPMSFHDALTFALECIPGPPKDSKDQLKKIALRNDAAVDWAIQVHDPFQDGFLVVQKWKKMKPSATKDKLEQSILKNEHLKYVLDPSNDVNLHHAIEEGEIEILKYLISRRQSPLPQNLLSVTIHSENADLAKFLIKEVNLIPNAENIIAAIYRGRLDILKVFIEEGECSPTEEDLRNAALGNRLEIVRYFVNELEIPITQSLMDYVNYYAIHARYRYSDKIDPIIIFVLRWGFARQKFKAVIRKLWRS